MLSVLCILDMLDATQPNACGYIRLFLPLTKKIVSDRLDVRFATLEDLPYFTADVVITQRTVINTWEKADRLLAYCRNTGAHLVFDLDDDLLSLPEHHPERRHYNELRSIVLRLIAEADEFWVTTQSLADRFIGIAQRVSVLPNELDDRIWRVRRDDSFDLDRPIRFLYMGTSTHRPDFERLVKPAWSELVRRFGKKIELDLIGVVDGASSDAEWTIVRPPTEIGNSYPAFATWLQTLRNYDVGLAPLLDSTFNRCKSDLKWLEYSAMDLATVAADLPAYSQSIEHERTGLLASANANGFQEAMDRLIVDSQLRQSLKRNASRVIEERLLAGRITEPRLERLLELAGRPKGLGFRAPPPRPVAPSEVISGRVDRWILSEAFIRGRGIEIGALQKPLPVPSCAEVRYVDRMSKTELYQHYPELRPFDLIEVDILDNGETLASFGNSSQNFIIVNHFIEHCQDPIGTIKNFIRVLRPGGIIYMAVPDMRHTFDRDRSRTHIEHIANDYICGPAASREQHFREWVTLVEPHFGRVYVTEESIECRIRELMTNDYSIHFHTFVPDTVRAMIDYCIESEGLPLSVVFGGEFGEEMIFILRKTGVTDEIATQGKSSRASADVEKVT